MKGGRGETSENMGKEQRERRGGKTEKRMTGLRNSKEKYQAMENSDAHTPTPATYKTRCT